MALIAMSEMIGGYSLVARRPQFFIGQVPGFVRRASGDGDDGLCGWTRLSVCGWLGARLFRRLWILLTADGNSHLLTMLNYSSDT